MGLPRQNPLMSCPSAIGLRSTSIGAPAAIVEASGFIWDMNGQAVKMLPPAAAGPVATTRQTRLVAWSAEEVVVVTIKPYLKLRPGGTAPQTPREHGQQT